VPYTACGAVELSSKSPALRAHPSRLNCEG
jgi:hypothetical protein